MKQNSSLFNYTKELVKSLESYSINYKYKSIYPLFQHLVLPFIFILKEYGNISQPFGKWFIYIMIFIMIIGVLINPILGNLIDPGMSINIAIFLAFFLVLFSLPSTYSHFNVQTDGINFIVNNLKVNIHDIKTAELIEKNLEKMFTKVQSRISLYRWLLGLSWTIYVFFINKSFQISLKSQEVNIDALVQEIINTSTSFLLFSLFIIFLIQSYKMASETLFKTIEFGIIEFKYQLLIKDNENK
ncbi:hypothetical protein [Sulfurimonas marina]|uniref:Uncharacterized protein n=1 Tax=Sulfurimonas marina TaxID=2590551 RepID=A0A7M1AXK3_9BACT|nr:hypothetical protein [Sulfurimonas marina]QOP42145.1 hypothetical protein FJR03_10525 [Sulfurimonas marina]